MIKLINIYSFYLFIIIIIITFVFLNIETFILRIKNNPTKWYLHNYNDTSSILNLIIDNKDNNQLNKTIYKRNIYISNTPILFIYITSSPLHYELRIAARKTWLTQCIPPKCDYRFFIDTTEKNTTLALEEEFNDFNDIVFRNSCSLMFIRHPDGGVNYGNSHPIKSHDYQLRKMYKIDWKVCFLKWAKKHAEEKSLLLNTTIQIAEFHTFVEDDSFICIGNLIHQMELLHNISLNNNGIKEFRTGYPKWDGFDDSSTIMTRNIALAFANHYPTPGFDCNHILINNTASAIYENEWLSWGNSWLTSKCNWRQVLLKHLNIDIIHPIVNCYTHLFNSSSKTHLDGVQYNPNDENLPLDFPCASNPRTLILHHDIAGELLLEMNQIKRNHMCEFILLVDKVKEPSLVYQIWGNITENNYFNLSLVFLNDYSRGWKKILNNFSSKNNHNLSNCLNNEKCIYKKRRKLMLRYEISEGIIRNYNELLYI